MPAEAVVKAIGTSEKLTQFFLLSSDFFQILDIVGFFHLA